MFGGLLRRLTSDRELETAANGLRDVAHRDAFFSDRMVANAGLTAFKREPEQAGGVKPMHCAPSVAAIVDIGGDLLLARERNQLSDKALPRLIVY